MVIIGEYRRIGGEPQQIHELWFLMSLLWGQFGFAALFADWRHNRARRFPLLLVFSLLPPLVLYLLVFGLA